ncbi:MAG TPA: DegQ family serine endoprotease [Candidatus Binataceae bacterium]|jgi:serine protease Do|nr:DegQ family serine endoprotease [Candidatus Binataceae bacterium]
MSKRVFAVVAVVAMTTALALANASAFSLWSSEEKPEAKPAPPAAAVPAAPAQEPAVTAPAPLAAEKPAPAPAPAGAPEPVEKPGVISSFAPLVKRVMPTVVNVSVVQKVKGFGMEGGDQPGEDPGSGQGGGGGPESGPGAGPGGPPMQPFGGPFGGGGGGGDPFEQFRRFFGEIPREFKQHGLGSGVIVSPDGYIMTNNHVVGNADTIQVTLMDKREFTAKVIGKDSKTDLALIKIDTKEPLPFAALGNSDGTEVGDWVVAIGNPFGFSLTVTAGIVSAKGRALGGNYDEFIQTDAAINPGNSGGPLFDVSGKVVGINTAIYSRTGTSAGIGFAIPIDLAKAVMDQLKSHGKVTRGWLGVEIQEVTPELAQSFGLARPDGALVANVEKDSPAAKSGIKRGDVIVKFNGHDVHEQHELPELVAETPIKKSVEVEVVRGGKHVTVPVTIGELKENEMASAGGAEQPGSGWGLQVGEITPDIAREFNLQSDKGIVVRQVKPDSPGAEAGLEQGDVILEVNHDKVNSLKDFMAHAKEAKDQKKPALLLVQRGNVTLYTVIKPED